MADVILCPPMDFTYLQKESIKGSCSKCSGEVWITPSNQITVKHNPAVALLCWNCISYLKLSDNLVGTIDWEEMRRYLEWKKVQR